MSGLTLESWREARHKNSQSLQRMQRNARVSERSWHGMAFLIEAMVLLAFVALAIAVFFRLFAYAKTTSTSNTELSQAVVYASNTAELFTADPEKMTGYAKLEEDYYITCDVTSKDTASGTLYTANIVVSRQEGSEDIYSLATQVYKRNGSAATVTSEDENATEEGADAGSDSTEASSDASDDSAESVSSEAGADAAEATEETIDEGEVM